MEWLLIPIALVGVMLFIWLKERNRRPYTWNCYSCSYKASEDSLTEMESARRRHLNDHHAGVEED